MEHDSNADNGFDVGATVRGDRAIIAPSLLGSRGLWQATLIMLVLLIGLGVLLTLFAPTLTGAVDETGRLLLALVLTILPALLWLALFYYLDRLEPEPHHYVLSLFVLGVLLGGSVQQPLLRQVFEQERWVVPGTTTHLLIAILLQGILTASLTYLAVRFTVMPTNEFDERVDGIIYGTAAALGLGVAVNLTYILKNGTISLGVGALTIIITSLAYATFGAIVGYFLGIIKPGGGSSLFAPLGVLIAGIVHGLYEWLAVQFGKGSLGYNPLASLIITSLFVSLTFAVVFWLIQLTYKTTTRNVIRRAPVTPIADWMVSILLIAALSVGWRLRQSTLFATQLIVIQEIEMAIPSNSIPLTGDDDYAAITSDGLTIRINVLPAPLIGVDEPIALITNRVLSQGSKYEIYQTISSKLYHLAEHPAGVLEYAYVDANNDSVPFGYGFFASYIQVIHGYELVFRLGDELYVLTLEGTQEKSEQLEELWARLTDSLRLSGDS